ncbi:TetR/AcrR family transcriptional regulator [Sphingomonas colocasiae]|uniref:TetR/AcrR family transcriptional regulator n=1 Tax=Sphingomonas colocasiae TaxID=1848973 RepID=A0ABS7Q263_9SPHN|nr:TetR/AcrR family transcriptional regulator [Sphingomonas colocasiae]MBY8826334.1 TetR/AcrR family transcriptional regulator [Sphingomonas colocasiae]
MTGERDKDVPSDLLKQRRAPVQARAQMSRDRILEVAGELLDEVGIDDFNTNLLAERAGVRIRTVYRYFPNKFAVIATIGEDMFERWSDWNAGYFLEIGKPDGDWATALREMIDGWIGRLAKEKGARAILQALGAIPQLRDLDRAAYARLVSDFEDALSRRSPADRRDVTTLSHVAVSAIYGLVDCYFRTPEDVRPLMAAELSEMIAGRFRAAFARA